MGTPYNIFKMTGHALQDKLVSRPGSRFSFQTLAPFGPGPATETPFAPNFGPGEPHFGPSFWPLNSTYVVLVWSWVLNLATGLASQLLRSVPALLLSIHVPTCCRWGSVHMLCPAYMPPGWHPPQLLASQAISCT